MSYQLTGTQNVSITALSTTTGYGSQGDWIVYESDGKFINNTGYSQTFSARHWRPISVIVCCTWRPDIEVFYIAISWDHV